jgi:2-amino-4-hydroxy-6-hydroxymethyldihydropteridine diphosphokinase
MELERAQDLSGRKSVTKCLIALGSNLPSQAGGSARTLGVALGLLAGESVRVAAISRAYRTPAWPPGSGPDFANAAAVVETTLSPADLLTRLHEVEATLGRIRKVRWGARAIDLDLIACGDLVLPDANTLRAWIDLAPEVQAVRAPDRMILPHPRVQDRAFVLVPLCDVAADWPHPLLGLTAAEMRDRLDPAVLAAIVPLSDDLVAVASAPGGC